MLNLLFHIPGRVQPVWTKADPACGNGKLYIFSSI